MSVIAQEKKKYISSGQSRLHRSALKAPTACILDTVLVQKIEGTNILSLGDRTFCLAWKLRSRRHSDEQPRAEGSPQLDAGLKPACLTPIPGYMCPYCCTEGQSNGGLPEIMSEGRESEERMKVRGAVRRHKIERTEMTTREAGFGSRSGKTSQWRLYNGPIP